MTDLQSHIEIPLSELPPCSDQFREVLEAVCESRFFKSSPKSCNFLKHVIDRTLEGNANELKERLIGMSLFGREATYDTGSDATVRVRANDVRKRLAAYNDEHRGAFSFELPAGSYVPRFYRGADIPSAVPLLRTIEPCDTPPRPQLSQLGLQRLATPTLCALFLCVIFLRWQIAQEHPFTAFWQGVFRDGKVTLYLPGTVSSGAQPLVRLQQVETSSPLLNLAGQFHSQIAVVDTPQTAKDDMLIVVGGSPHNGQHASMESDAAQAVGRLAVEDTADGPRILDRNNLANSPAVNGPAALLTIVGTPHRRIEIDGTNNDAIRAAVQLLCDRDSFPEILADDNQSDGTTQVIFPVDAQEKPILFHDSATASSVRPTGDQ